VCTVGTGSGKRWSGQYRSGARGDVRECVMRLLAFEFLVKEQQASGMRLGRQDNRTIAVVVVGAR